MANYNNTKALKAGEIQKAHLLTAFYKTNTVKNFNGSGWFTWIDEDNTSKTEVTGLLLKPTSLTNGYWLRITDNILTPEMFGATGKNLTMAAQNLTQGEADALYGSGFCNVNTDTWDWAAIQYMINYIGLENATLRNCRFSSNSYYLNKSIKLPNITWSADHFIRINLDGNSCDIKPYNNPTYQTFPFFYMENPSDFPNAEGVQANKCLTIKNFNFLGRRSNTANKSYSLKLAGGTFCRIEDCHFKSTDYGFWGGFNINTCIENCFAQFNDIGYYLGQDTVLSGDCSKPASNVAVLKSCKASGCNTGIYFDKVNNCYTENTTFEGIVNYGVYFNGDCSVVKSFEVKNIHWEECTGVCVYIKGNEANVVIDRIDDFSANTVLVESESFGTTYITVKNIAYLQPTTKFAHKGAADAITFWTFDKVACRNNTIRDAANWVVSGAYSVPKPADREIINSNPQCKVQITSNINNSGVTSTVHSARLWEYNNFMQTTVI